jgi:hypothetical protein
MRALQFLLREPLDLWPRRHAFGAFAFDVAKFLRKKKPQNKSAVF